MGRLVINGDEVYELDEACMREKAKEAAKKRIQECVDEMKGRKKQGGGEG